jgi:hypothetical protein
LRFAHEQVRFFPLFSHFGFLVQRRPGCLLSCCQLGLRGGQIQRPDIRSHSATAASACSPNLLCPLFMMIPY